MAEAARKQRFEELYHDNYGAVRGYLLRRADPEVAQDALSETFLAAWRRLDKLPPDPLPWLLGTARKALANQRRSSRRLSDLRDRAAGAEVPAGGDPAEHAGEAELVRRALGELSERDREALLLIAWEGLDPGRAAVAAGCSRAAFAVRVHRARQRLKTALGESTRTVSEHSHAPMEIR
jgi:RNA polymerase sigma-70 factor (ECF subfamily)